MMLQKQVGASDMSWVDKVLPSATEDEMEEGEAVDEVACFGLLLNPCTCLCSCVIIALALFLDA
jgi:hypothetical protein